MQPVSAPVRTARPATAPVTHTEALRLQLSDAIVSGQLEPGTPLDEQELATRFGVSRTPVREAIRQLSASGLVSVRPHRGAVVALPTPSQLNDMFEAMAELEALCAGLAARNMTVPERRGSPCRWRWRRASRGLGGGGGGRGGGSQRRALQLRQVRLRARHHRRVQRRAAEWRGSVGAAATVAAATAEGSAGRGPSEERERLPRLRQ